MTCISWCCCHLRFDGTSWRETESCDTRLAPWLGENSQKLLCGCTLEELGGFRGVDLRDLLCGGAREGAWRGQGREEMCTRVPLADVGSVENCDSATVAPPTIANLKLDLVTRESALALGMARKPRGKTTSKTE